MRILLANTDENNWFSCSVNHVKSSTNFIIYCVKFGHDNSINCSWIIILNRVINQTLIELLKLINGIISYESFSYKQNSIRLIDMNQFGKSFHQSFISLHSSSCINQNNIIVFSFCFLQSFLSNNSWVIFVALLIKRNVKTFAMSV